MSEVNYLAILFIFIFDIIILYVFYKFVCWLAKKWSSRSYIVLEKHIYTGDNVGVLIKDSVVQRSSINYKEKK